MSELKVYTPTVIDDAPFPEEEAASSTVSDTVSQDTYKPTEKEDIGFPTPKIAVELIGTALNTRSKKILASFEFTPSGAIQIGNYTDGISGDIKISPSGIVARNSLGDTTFALDGETGDAFFSGIIQAGTVISGLVVVGDNRVVIDGLNSRIVINDGTYDRVILGKF